MNRLLNLISLCCFILLGGAQATEVVVIGNSNLSRLDATTVQKIYTGKVISVAGVSIVPMALKPGTPPRNQFLQDFLSQDEEKYTAYWTVRRYIGKGVPPNELENASAMIDYIKTTPGAIGYIDKAELKGEINVLLQK